MFKPELLDDEIGRKLAEAQANGELQAAAGYGQPSALDEGWQQTPEALRMPFKILKNAGVVPQEVEMLKQRATLRALLDGVTDEALRQQVMARLAALEQSLALRLEALRRQG